MLLQFSSCLLTARLVNYPHAHSLGKTDIPGLQETGHGPLTVELNRANGCTLKESCSHSDKKFRLLLWKSPVHGPFLSRYKGGKKYPCKASD